MITADFTLVLVFINFLWAVYFYWTQWFGITAFASNVPKLQDAVKITATGPLLVLCKYYQQKISERSRLYIRAVMDQIVKQGNDFAMYFY